MLNRTDVFNGSGLDVEANFDPKTELDAELFSEAMFDCFQCISEALLEPYLVLRLALEADWILQPSWDPGSYHGGWRFPLVPGSRLLDYVYIIYVIYTYITYIYIYILA
jgi:hypothetical protein